MTSRMDLEYDVSNNVMCGWDVEFGFGCILWLETNTPTWYQVPLFSFVVEGGHSTK